MMRFNAISRIGRSTAIALASGVAAFAVVMTTAPSGIADPDTPPGIEDNSPPTPIIHPDPNDPSIPYRPDIVPLPQIVPAQANWTPKYPFPFDQMRNEVTEADIKAEAEMCQWFTAQFDTLTTQVDTLTYLLAGTNGKYVDGINEKADIVTANIFQSADFLAPRAQALTQNTDFAGDVYFPLYQGENFYSLWQQLHNVGIGIQSRHSSWHFGPPRTLMEHYASGIRRSHVCR